MIIYKGKYHRIFTLKFIFMPSWNTLLGSKASTEAHYNETLASFQDYIL